MGEVVNLRLVRKAKTRAAKSAEADANRASHGRTKAERLSTETLREAANRHLDGHRRDASDPSAEE